MRENPICLNPKSDIKINGENPYIPWMVLIRDSFVYHLNIKTNIKTMLYLHLMYGYNKTLVNALSSTKHTKHAFLVC